MSDRNHSHVIEVDEGARLVKIDRIFSDGKRELLTQIALPDPPGSDYTEFGRRLAECILWDSPAGQRIPGASLREQAATAEDLSANDLFATRRFRARWPDGVEFEIDLGVGRPVRCGENHWKCGVALKGLYDRLADQHGVDSWQALTLAQALARQLLQGFVEEGGKLMDLETAAAVKVEDIFSGK